MFHSQPRKPRPLGTVYSVTGPLQVKPLIIPKLLPGINAETDKFQERIQGSALTIPSHSSSMKDSSHASACDRPKPDESGNQPSKMVSDSSVSHESCKKKINEGLVREKDLKNQIELLNSQLDQLKVTVARKEEDIKLLEDQIVMEEKKYTVQLNEEKSGHEMTKVILSETRNKIVEAHKSLEQLVHVHNEEMRKQKEESEKHLMGRLAEKDSIIIDRDQKISRLKLQMAEALKGNSWERQQQLDELTKELSRLNEECNMLRMKLKSVIMNKQTQCSNCEENCVKVQQLQATVQDKNFTIKELKSLCDKFEAQLSTQDKLLEQWAFSKGQKIIAPK